MSNDFVTVKRADLDRSLEALGEIAQNSEDKWQVDAAIKAANPLRAALEQPGVEPVTRKDFSHAGCHDECYGCKHEHECIHAAEDDTPRQPAQQPEADKLLRQALEAMEVQGSEWVILERNAIAAIREYFGEA